MKSEHSQARKAALLSSLGAGFEYFDFVIYGMMAEYLSILFFEGDDSWIGLMKTFGIFAIGYFVRPFGGILFGLVGDSFGRKKSFVFVMLLMATATFGIGLLPTYAQIGVLAPILLVILRMLQGISFGAELPGAMTMVYEFAQKKKQSTYTGLVLSSASVGAMMASLVLYCLAANLSKEQILTWGWRGPFLLGGMLAVVNYYIRQRLDETPEFLRAQAAPLNINDLKEPLVYLFRSHFKSLMLGIGMTSFVSALIILALYFPTYLTVHFGYDSTDVYLAGLWSLGASAVIMPFCGRLADRVGKEYLMIATSLGYISSVFGLFSLLELHVFWALQLFMVLHQVVIALISVCYFPLLAQAFPTRVRYTGIAAAYNITYSLAAILPLALTALIYYTNNSDSVIWIMVCCAAFSALSTMRLLRSQLVLYEK